MVFKTIFSLWIGTLLLWSDWRLRAQLQITRVGQWPGHQRGPVQDVQTVGNRAYLALGTGGLAIYDVSDPASPRPLGGTATPGISTSIQIVGNLAYVADGPIGMRILDISNPTNITVVGFFDTRGMGRDVSSPSTYDGHVYRLQVVGNLAYITFQVLSKETRLIILNVSQPNQIVLAGYYQLPPYQGLDLAVVGSRAFVVSGFRLVVLDVSDPTRIKELGTDRNENFATGPLAVHHLVGQTNIALVSTSDGKFKALDTTIPTNITLASSLQIDGRVNRFEVQDGRAYLADERGFVHVLDVSDPTRMTKLSTITNGGALTSIRFRDSRAYVGAGVDGLHILDLSQPTNASRLGTIITKGFSSGVQVVGNSVYLADGPGGLRVFDVSNPTTPRLSATIKTAGEAIGVTVRGGFAYVAEGAAGVEVFDVADPTNAFKSAAFNTPGFASSITLAGTNAYVVDGDSGLQVLDVSQPGRLAQVGTYTGLPACEVAVAENYAYLAVSTALVFHYLGLGVDMLDIGILTNIQSRGFYYTLDSMFSFRPISGTRMIVEKAGNYLYAADNWSLRVLDITNPTNFVFRGGYGSFKMRPMKLRVSGEYVFLMREGAGLQVLDLSNITNISLLGQYTALGNSQDLQLDGDLVYVADGNSGLTVLRAPRDGFLTQRTTFAKWISIRGPGLDSGMRAPDADPDMDGSVNLLEYLVNADPTKQDALPFTIAVNANSRETNLVCQLVLSPYLDDRVDWWFESAQDAAHGPWNRVYDSYPEYFNRRVENVASLFVRPQRKTQFFRIRTSLRSTP